MIKECIKTIVYVQVFSVSCNTLILIIGSCTKALPDSFKKTPLKFILKSTLLSIISPLQWLINVFSLIGVYMQLQFTIRSVRKNEE